MIPHSWKLPSASPRTVRAIEGTRSAFAALREDGAVVAWGHAEPELESRGESRFLNMRGESHVMFWLRCYGGETG